MTTTIIEIITVEWTKKSRGEPMASVRNAVPETAPLAAADTMGPGVYLQQVTYAEWDGFKAPIAKPPKLINEHQQREHGFTFETDSEGTVVHFWGAPDRRLWHPKRLGPLQENRWLRVVTNARVQLEYTSAYRKHVFNVFVGDPSKFDSVLHNPPLAEYRLEVDLW